ncbi:MAG: hypothetical protein IT426_09405 [Pirellulales bacterium]|nr:hypothetical protein [Pirellulales bacterium]
MAFMDYTFIKSFGGGKNARGIRKAPARKRAKRLGTERLEQRMLLSANLTGSGATHNLYEFMASASLAGASRYGIAGASAAANKFAPAAPSFTATARSESRIDLAWTRVSGATGYVVKEWVIPNVGCIRSGDWQEIARLGSGSTGFSVTGLSAGTAYSFEVAALNWAGTTWSNPVSATTLQKPPAAPAFTATARSASQIDLAWTAVSGASGYLIDQWIDGAWQQIVSLGNGGTSFSVAGLSAGRAYWFDVAAYNSAGTSWGKPAMATTLSNSPTAPLFTAMARSASRIDLSWTAVPGATSYLVGQWINGAWQQIGTLGNGGTSFSVTGLSAGTTYSFDVAACNSLGTTWGKPVSAATLPQPPAAPSLTLTVRSASQIDLAWAAVSGATGYLINQRVNGAWQQIAKTGSDGIGCSISGLDAGATYSFQVAACNAGGTTWSNVQNATTLQKPPAAPSLTAKTYSTSQIDLSWARVSGATGYLINQWVNGAWKQIAKTGSDGSSYSVKNLIAATAYSFQVAAYNSAGTTWSSVQNAKTSVVVNHPLAAAPYSPASGKLFGANGPSYADVRQGDVGDCWLLASLAAVAARDPAIIRSMFTAAGTNVENGAVVDLYTVRFFNGAGVAKYVTVDTVLPWGNNGGYYDHPVNGVLWAALAEKAYVQANAAGYVTTFDTGVNSYGALDNSTRPNDSRKGGMATWALQAITGKPASAYAINPPNIAAAWNAGKPIVIVSSSKPADPYIVGSSKFVHAYAVVGYAASSKTPYTVFNPWGVNSSDNLSPGIFNGHKVYGRINGNAAFLSQNFQNQSIGSRGAPGVEAETPRGFETAMELLSARGGLSQFSYRQTGDGPLSSVDSTPALNVAYAAIGIGRPQAIDSRAVDRMDLSSVVEDELGRLAGLDNLDWLDSNLRSGLLGKGIRRSAIANEVEAALVGGDFTMGG